VPKLDLEKSQYVVMMPSSLPVLTSLVGVRVSKLDPGKSQWKVELASDSSS